MIFWADDMMARIDGLRPPIPIEEMPSTKDPITNLTTAKKSGKQKTWSLGFLEFET
jgi:hypothetical protein